MKTLILITLISSLNSFSGVFSVFRQQKSFTGYCDVTDTGYRTAKQACESGKFNGQKIYQCEKKKSGWEVLKVRTCNSDGEKVGYYVNSCAGAALEVDSIKDACTKVQNKDQVIVKCRKGKEVGREYCHTGAGNDDDREIAIFDKTCNGAKLSDRNDLNLACKEFPGKLLMKCANNCAQRMGLQCTKRVWMEKASMQCPGGEIGDATIKFKDCTPDETQKILDSFKIAQTKVSSELQKLKNNLVSGGNLSATTKDQLQKSQKIFEKIQNKLLDKKSVHVCQSQTKYCSTGPNAHTLNLPGLEQVKYCGSFFNYNNLKRGAVIVHEFSHHFGTIDAEDFGLGNPPVNGKTIKWDNNPETFEYWVQYGFCIPEVNCK